MPLPQRIAALPTYLDSTSTTNFADAAPGHRFQMYFRNWQGPNGNAFASYKSARPIGREEREVFNRETADTLRELCLLGPSAQLIVAGLIARQSALIKVHGEFACARRAVSTAPFATGLGNEHPIENGFAFLTPYGLPYLAGSGVKGVLRRSAEELAFENDGGQPEGWTWLDIWWLFGFEGAASKSGPAAAIFDPETEQGRAFGHHLPQLAQRDDLRDFIGRIVGDGKERARYLDRTQDRRADFLTRLVSDDAFRQSLHYRGALDFWDCFPQSKDNKLVVEIMTPHFGDYYQGKNAKREVLAVYPNGAPPHDAGQPVPVSFLAVPAGSYFDFRVVCRPDRLPEALRLRWRALVDAAFDHAFGWLGFGAKTAVGYGAMEARQESADQSTSQAGDDRKMTTATYQAGAPQRIWEKAQIKFNASNGTLTAIWQGNPQANALAPRGQELLASLPIQLQQKVKQNQFVRVIATVRGNELVAIQAIP
jgi:CRISPR-associated protein Cmr6